MTARTDPADYLRRKNIETQEQLLDRLLDSDGIKSTQATISRDIKQMHLIKEPMGQGMSTATPCPTTAPS
jgi:transcriptional regulator of arginine metabolism